MNIEIIVVGEGQTQQLYYRMDLYTLEVVEFSCDNKTFNLV